MSIVCPYEEKRLRAKTYNMSNPRLLLRSLQSLEMSGARLRAEIGRTADD